MSNLAYYITAHGYGHGVRSCDILNALHRARPDWTLHVVTDLPEAYLRSRLPAERVRLRTAAFDSGMFQLDSIRVDLPRSLAVAQAIQAQRARLRAGEQTFLERQEIRVVVADIPGIPLEAAKRAGVPAVAVGNFGWDWIYGDFVAREPAWAPVAAAFREAYAQAGLLLRLPFAEPMEAFPVRRDIPLVASPGWPRRDELARLTGADPDKPWVLLSFTTLEWDAEALAKIARLDRFEFFSVLPLAWPDVPTIRAVDRRMAPFSDVIASCDVVVSKPGYGILSDCVVNAKPLVYVERTDFCEYPVLEAALKRHLRHVHLPAAQLYAGDVRAAIEAALVSPPACEPVGRGGEAQAADAILARA